MRASQKVEGVQPLGMLEGAGEEYQQAPGALVTMNP
jgi:hypothetical protein